jgi:hypothetical protein
MLSELKAGLACVSPRKGRSSDHLRACAAVAGTSLLGIFFLLSAVPADSMGHEQRRRGPWYERYPPSELLQLDEQVSKEEALPAQHELDPPHMDTLPMQHALLPPRKGGKALVLAPSDASNTQASIYNFKDSHGGDASAYRTLLKRSGAAGLAGACLSEFPDSFRAGCELEADVSKQQDLEGVLSACTVRD